MTATLVEARDAIYELLKAAWDATGYIMLWDDLSGEPPETTSPWARSKISFNTGGQASLSNDQGKARFNRAGFLTIQVFTPAGEGLDDNLILAQLILDAYEGVSTSNGVWFRNARYNPVGNSGDFFQGNVLVDFTYDEVK